MDELGNLYEIQPSKRKLELKQISKFFSCEQNRTFFSWGQSALGIYAVDRQESMKEKLYFWNPLETVEESCGLKEPSMCLLIFRKTYFFKPLQERWHFIFSIKDSLGRLFYSFSHRTIPKRFFWVQTGLISLIKDGEKVGSVIQGLGNVHESNLKFFLLSPEFHLYPSKVREPKLKDDFQVVRQMWNRPLPASKLFYFCVCIFPLQVLISCAQMLVIENTPASKQNISSWPVSHH